MHATSTQPFADARRAATALLAASIFAAGVALGAVVGISAAPVVAPAEVSVGAFDPDADGLRQYRDGEINVGASDPDADGLRQHRDGEINVGASDPDANGLRQYRDGEINAGADPATVPLSTERRENINSGQ